MSQLLERHGLIKKDSLKDCTSLRQIDDRVTSKVWGYKGWEDFYSDACLSENEVLNVKIPLIFLNSLDDPLIYDDDRMVNDMRIKTTNFSYYLCYNHNVISIMCENDQRMLIYENDRMVNDMRMTDFSYYLCYNHNVISIQ